MVDKGKIHKSGDLPGGHPVCGNKSPGIVIFKTWESVGCVHCLVRKPGFLSAARKRRPKGKVSR